MQTALRVANVCFAEWFVDDDETGPPWSFAGTQGATAMLGLLSQLNKAGLVGGALTVNGQRIGARAAAQSSERVEVIEAGDGACLVELTRERSLRWAEATSAFPVRAGLCSAAGRPTTKPRRGERVELVVSLPHGTVEGDIVEVCLPAALAPLRGHGQPRSRRVRVDFAGRDEVRLALLVAQELTGPQSFALVVRNVFDEERAASPGLIVIERG